MRILVLRGGALGDFIVTLPALRLLRTRWPEAEIVLVGNARAAELGVMSGELSAAHSQHEAKWAALYQDTLLSHEIREWFEGFDWVLSFWADADGTLQRNLSFIGNRLIHGGATVETKPAAQHFCRALQPLGLTAETFESILNLSDRAQAGANGRLDGLTDFWAIHPGSGSAQKNWPQERWQQLCTQLSEPLLIISGEADRDPRDWLNPPEKPVRFARDWPLPILAAALQRARGFIGHDTGVSHLAAAVGTQSVLLFGPTNPAIWAPPGSHVHVVRESTSMQNITVEKAFTQINAVRLGVAPASPLIKL